MSEFPDPIAFVGRVGALTALGPVHGGLGWSFSLRFRMFRALRNYGIFRGYVELPTLQELYGLRWTLLRLPGAKRQYLLFETIFVDDWEAYLTHLVQNSAFGINAHAYGGVGYPGLDRVDVFLRYLAEHHRPAAHLYVHNPHATPRDLNQARIALHAIDQRDATPSWFSALIPIPAAHLGAVRDVVARWNARSGFRGPHHYVHHGRFVIIEEGATTCLLLTVLHSAPPGIGRTRYRTRARQSDRTLLLDLLEDPNCVQPWSELFTACGLTFPTVLGAVEYLLDARIGVAHHDAIRTVDAVWNRSPRNAEELFRKYAERSKLT